MTEGLHRCFRVFLWRIHVAWSPYLYFGWRRLPNSRCVNLLTQNKSLIKKRTNDKENGVHEEDYASWRNSHNGRRKKKKRFQLQWRHRMRTRHWCQLAKEKTEFRFSSGDDVTWEKKHRTVGWTNGTRRDRDHLAPASYHPWDLFFSTNWRGQVN